MNQQDEISAYKVVNTYEEEALGNVLFNYGELRNARALAKAIVSARMEKPVKTTEDLKVVLKQFLPGSHPYVSVLYIQTRHQ